MSAEVSRLNRHFPLPLSLLLLAQYPEDIIALFLSKSAWWGEGEEDHSAIPLDIPEARPQKGPQSLDSPCRADTTAKSERVPALAQENPLQEAPLPPPSAGVR